jgi:hypothetical protein
MEPPEKTQKSIACRGKPQQVMLYIQVGFSVQIGAGRVTVTVVHGWFDLSL